MGRKSIESIKLFKQRKPDLMKPFRKMVFLFLTWITNLSAPPAFTKVAVPSYEFSFSKTENVKTEIENETSNNHFFVIDHP